MSGGVAGQVLDPKGSGSLCGDTKDEQTAEKHGAYMFSIAFTQNMMPAIDTPDSSQSMVGMLR